MLAVDIIGLLFTVCLIGIRYPYYVLLVVAIHQTGQIFMALFLNGHIDTVIAAGAFGSITVSQISNPIYNILIVFSGPLVNYMASSITGGIIMEPTAILCNPLAKLKQPFAVINLRLALIATVISLWNLVL